jgi:nucleotide-binding universal stress UspA family protein
LIRKILVPIDGSKHSHKALDFALDFFKDNSVKIEILNVIPNFNVHTPYVKPAPEYEKVELPEWMKEYIEKINANHEKVVSEALKKVREKKPNLKVSARLAEGRPAEKIVEISKEENFDLIVIGSKGLGGVKKFFLGGVTDRVADEAECPVLIVK